MKRQTDSLAAHASPPGQKRPVIRCEAGNLPRMVDAAEAALIATGAPVYSRGAMLVTPALDLVPASDGGEFLSPRLQEVKDTWLIERLTATARFERFDARSRDFKPTDCPRKIAVTLIERQRWRLPALAGIVSAPTLRGDGSLIHREGYDARSRLILDFQGVRFPSLADQPGQAEASAALRHLLEAFSTFPAVADCDRAVVASCVITALLRRSLPTAPLHAVTAHEAGSGKSLLVDVAAIIATGRRAPVVAAGRSAEEFEKRLVAMLLQGDALFSLDNLAAPLDGDLLAQALTQEAVKLRPLGRSEAREVPAGAMIFATGNNLRIAGDLTRRCLIIRLDPQCERPEQRTFKRDALAYARARRGTLVRAALTIVRAYALAGRPAALAPLGSFEAWSRIVREAIVWAGGADPVRTMETVRASDPAREELRTVIWAWRDAFGDARTAAADAAQRAISPGPLRDALMAIAADRGQVDARRLGNWLSRIVGQRLDGARFVEDGKRRGSALWKLEGAEGLAG